VRSRNRFGICLRIVIFILIIGAGLELSGCIWLAIPGLAYSGYQYEKTGKLPGMPSTGSSGDKDKASSQATPSDSIE
jgi:hypothetical protein